MSQKAMQDKNKCIKGHHVIQRFMELDSFLQALGEFRRYLNEMLIS